MSIPALLITGAGGFIGAELALRLAEIRRGWRIYLHSRDAEKIRPELRRPQFTILEGDIRTEGLGLTRLHTQSLQRSLREVIHCAADTRLDRSLDELRAVNVTGTENVLRFAHGCPSLSRVLYLSTVCVAGRSTGRIPETVIQHQSRFSNFYQQSKYEAEQLVSAKAWKAPTVIARISTIAGDSRDGHVQQQNYLHHLLKIFPRCSVPFIPSDPGAVVDFVAADWVIDSLVWLYENEFEPAAVWHLCGSDANGYRVDELLADTHRLFATHPKASRSFPFAVPKLGTLAAFDDYRERMRLEGTVMQNELLRVLNYFLPHLGIPQVFDNRQTMELLGPSGLAQPGIRPLYAGVVRWCLDTDFGQCA